MFNTIFTMLVAAHAPYPIQLAQSINTISAEYHIDPILMTKVILVESNGNANAINQKTHDYGILQFHLDSHPEISYECAMQITCALKEGARILKSLNRICEYNIGRARLTDNRLQKCLIYERKLATITKGY